MYLDNRTDDYLGGGINTDRSIAFVYNSFFCLRRFFMVICFFIFKDETGMETIFSTLAITTAYVVYITHSSPHCDSYFNYLEIFNECMFVAITYTFFGYASSEIEPLLDPHE